MPHELIEIVYGLFIQPEKVTAVKRSELDDEACTVFVSGQSSQDGFLVQRSAEEVAEEINLQLSAEEE